MRIRLPPRRATSSSSIVRCHMRFGPPRPMYDNSSLRSSCMLSTMDTPLGPGLAWKDDVDGQEASTTLSDESINEGRPRQSSMSEKRTGWRRAAENRTKMKRAGQATKRRLKLARRTRMRSSASGCGYLPFLSFDGAMCCDAWREILS